MARRVANFIATLSIAANILLVLIWIRSYRASDCISFMNTTQQRFLAASTQRGRIAVLQIRMANAERFSSPKPGIQFDRFEPPSSEPTFAWRFAGIGYCDLSAVYGAQSAWLVSVPLWLVQLAALTILVFGLRPSRRRPDEVGHCQNCGYDLRATPERCPECGAVATVTPSSVG